MRRRRWQQLTFRCAAVERAIVIAEDDILEVIVKIDNDFSGSLVPSRWNG
jgi:hypothetical protein